MDWLIQHSTDHYTHQKCRKFIHLCLSFFCPIYAYFLRITLSISLPFVTRIRGHMARTPLSSLLPCVPSFLSRETASHMFRIMFPSRASPCVELVRIHATYQYNAQHAGCEELSAVSLYTDAFVSGVDLDPNEHTRHTL